MKRICTIISTLYLTIIIASTQMLQAKTPPNNKETASNTFALQEELRRQRMEAADDIALTTTLLAEADADTKTSLNHLLLLSQQLKSRKKIISLLEKEMAALDSRIKSINNDIEILNGDLAKTKENYARSMQNQLQEHHTAQYKMLLILSAQTLSQSYRRMRYLHEYANWKKEEAERIIKKQDEISLRKTQLEETRKNKQILIAQREQEIEVLKIEEAQQRKEVKELSKRQKELQRRLQQKKQEVDALDEQLNKVIGEYLKKQESTTKTITEKKPVEKAETPKSVAAPKEKNDTAPKEKKDVAAIPYTLSAKDFVGNKGRLPYPLTEKYTIISHFGEHQHQELTHVRINNNGIDLQTTVGAEARAVFKGVVTHVFVMPGFNNNVIVRHGSYLTVYGNISQVYVKAGDIVETRQAIGKIFTDTAKGNETILHFQIWKERTKLNPEAWLKK